MDVGVLGGRAVSERRPFLARSERRRHGNFEPSHVAVPLLFPRVHHLNVTGLLLVRSAPFIFTLALFLADPAARAHGVAPFT